MDVHRQKDLSPSCHDRKVGTCCSVSCCVPCVAPSCGPAGRPCLRDRIFLALGQPRIPVRTCVVDFRRGRRSAYRYAPATNRGTTDARSSVRQFSSLHCIFAFCIRGDGTKSTTRQPQPAKPRTIQAGYRERRRKRINDPALEALRKQLGEVAQHKDRAALAKLVVGQGFFWIGEKGDRADKRRSGIDNLAAALGLKNKDGAGWDMLASFADDPTGAPLPEPQGSRLRTCRPCFRQQGFQ